MTDLKYFVLLLLMGIGSLIFGDMTISIVGEGTFIGSRSVVGNCSMIGKYCSISKDVKIGMVNHPLHLPFTSPRLYLEKYKIVQENLFNHDEIKPVTIENNVLISANR